MVMNSNMDFCVFLTIINILCSSQFVLYHIFSRGQVEHMHFIFREPGGDSILLKMEASTLLIAL